jgi:hypothetical protein
MKLIVKKSKSRNPLVVAALMRRAGAHGASGRSRRQRSDFELRRELDRLFKPSP